MTTTTEILEVAHLTLTFEGKPYKVRPLNIGKAREWRKQLMSLDAARVKSLAKYKEEGGDRFERAVHEFNPDFLVDLVVNYCSLSAKAYKSLNGDVPVTREIIESGTLVEVSAAFEKIVEIEFPLQAVTAGQKALVAAWSGKQ